MFKKFLAVFIVCLGIFAINVPANATVAKIYRGSNFRQMTTGTLYYAQVVNCNEWISLRREPSVYSERIYKIPLGTTLIVRNSITNGFYETYYHGSWGWCLQEYIQLGSIRTGDGDMVHLD